MAHIFVSYSRKDKDYARKLVDHLLALGFDIWFDEHIEYGSNWEQAIQRAIDTCAAFIVVMSPASAESAWVRNESAHAADRNKPIYPLLLDGEAFLRFKTTQYVDVRGGVLPSDEFIAKLAEHATRATHTGKRYGAAESGGIRTFQRPPSVPAPTQTRRLESAMPRQTQRAVPTEVRVKVSLPESIGLRGELPDVTEYGDEIKKSDVRESGFPLAFPVDFNGKPLPLKLCAQVESDHYDVRYPANDCGVGQADIELPPDTDSRTVIVALHPRDTAYVGRASVTVRLLRDGKVVAENVVVTRVVEQVQEVGYGLGSAQLMLATAATGMAGAARALPDVAPPTAELQFDKSLRTGNTDVTKTVRRMEDPRQSAVTPSPVVPEPSAAAPVQSTPEKKFAPPMPAQRKTATRGRFVPFVGLVGILLAGIVGVLTLTPTRTANVEEPAGTGLTAASLMNTATALAAAQSPTQLSPTLPDTGGGVLTGTISSSGSGGGGTRPVYTGSPTTGFAERSAVAINTQVIIRSRASVQVVLPADDDDNDDDEVETINQLWLEIVLSDQTTYWIPAEFIELAQGATLDDIPEWTG